MKKQLTRKQFGFQENPEKKSPEKKSLHPNKLLKNQLRTKINGTVTSQPEQVRTKREKAVKKGYDDMLATGVL